MPNSSASSAEGACDLGDQTATARPAVAVACGPDLKALVRDTDLIFPSARGLVRSKD